MLALLFGGLAPPGGLRIQRAKDLKSVTHLQSGRRGCDEEGDRLFPAHTSYPADWTRLSSAS